MKKKTIERIPYLGLPGVKRGKAVRYVGVTAIMEVSGQEHFFLEVYRNRRDGRDVPVARLVFAPDDFGTFLPGTGEWTGRACKGSYGSLIWEEEYRRPWTKDRDITENVLYSGEDLERMQGYFCCIRVWDKERWWDYARQRQEEIRREESHRRAGRRMARRRQALEDRIRDTPELPEASILEYADRHIFRGGHYLYYRKAGRRAVVACTACGQVSEGIWRWRPDGAYEEQYRRHIQEPMEGFFGTCQACGASGKYIPQGRAKSTRRREKHVFLGQRYKGTGMVFRYVRVEKEYVLDEYGGEKGPEMLGAKEELYGIEIARAYFEEGKKPQVDYKKHDCYEGKDFWDDCNLYGNANITVGEGAVLPETYAQMEGTFLQYSALREYQEAAGEVNPFRYMERYTNTPQVEMLVKLGFTEVVRKLLRYEYGIVADENAGSVDGFLGIRKEKVRYAAAHRGEEERVRLLQMEKRMGQFWTDEQVEHLVEAGIRPGQCHGILRHMTVQKLLNRVERYAGCGYGTGLSCCQGQLMRAAQLYTDYLELREQLGYDLGNTVYQQPRDLAAAHNRMVHESNKKEQDKRLKEVAEAFPMIRKNYRSLRRQYFYQDDTYLIRPARSAEEIVMEGRILHHCVGGDHYLRSHDQGENIILFLRCREDPDMPYITVEMGKGFRIRQWYGAHDRKPDEKNMQGWLDAYVTRLKCGTVAAGMDAGGKEGLSTTA